MAWPCNNYKLVSRILFLNYHLSGMLIAQHLFLPTLPVIRKYYRKVNGQLTWRTMNGSMIQPHGIYMAFQHARFTPCTHYCVHP